MAIQQVASGNSNGIMSFLFQDDGSTEGTVLEGAEFARTLHQLLGETDGAESPGTEAGKDVSTDVESTEEKPTKPHSKELASAVTEGKSEQHEPKVSTLSLTQDLDTLIKDFQLPEHSAKLPAEAGIEGEADGQELEQPFWGVAPFSDVSTALQEHTAALRSSTTELECTAANDAAAATEHAETAAPLPPTFSNGIAHVIEMARDAAQVSADLTQQPATPRLPALPAAGRNAPLGGKTLPQGYRGNPAAPNLGPATGSAAKTTQAAPSADVALPMPAGETTASNTFFADLLSIKAEAPGQQSAPQTPNMTPGIHALHANSSVANLPKAANEAAPANPMPHMQSPHLAGTDAWFQDLGARVDWLKDMKVDKAELQLHPAELGLLEIHISAGDDATTVSFVTHNTEARQLIEESMPRLRELLASQGMQLGQSHVSQHSDGGRRGHEHAGTASAQRDNSATDEPAPVRHRAYIADPNRIDHYV